VHVTGPATPQAIDVRGPQGGAPFDITPPQTIALPFNALFGPAAAIAPDDALTLTIGAKTLNLPIPFTQPTTIGGFEARAELV
jgi:hypothetical protein